MHIFSNDVGLLLDAEGSSCPHSFVYTFSYAYTGKWAYYGVWLYCSLCMAVFLVRTLKRAVFQEARNYGKDYIFPPLTLIQPWAVLSSDYHPCNRHSP